jgi:NodT family efflux transporter outer membrane factor (OMF) lipoprotein
MIARHVAGRVLGVFGVMKIGRLRLMKSFHSLRMRDLLRDLSVLRLSPQLSRCSSLLCVSMLTGCIPDAEIPSLAIDVPAVYTNGGTKRPADPPKVEWWTSFHSAELNRFMQETNQNNYDIAASVGRIVQADALARQTGAALLPSLTAGDSATRSQQPASVTNTGTGSFRRTTLQTTLTASYEIDFWGKNRAAFQATEETAYAARWDRDTVALSSLASTASTYFAILGARERVKLAQDNLRLSSNILAVIKNRVTVGTATSLQEAQQEALVENLRASIPPLQQMADQDIATLSILLGRAPEHVAVRGTAIAQQGMPRIAAGLPSEVILQRPDVQMAEAQLASAHANLVSARAAFFPSITLTGQGGFASAALQSLFTPGAGLYSLAANLSQPIFDAGLLQAKFDQQKGIQDELLADYRKSVLTAFSDVEKALIALRDLAHQEDLLKQSLAASQRAYDLSVDQLNAGTLDIVTLLQTQQTLFTTKDTLSQVHLARLQAAISLYQALGGGWVAARTGGAT